MKMLIEISPAGFKVLMQGKLFAVVYTLRTY